VGRDPNEVFSRDGLLDDLKKALSERILNTELDQHLDDEREADGHGNRRNGHSKKTVLTGTSKMQLPFPRDRAGTFDPKLIAKYQSLHRSDQRRLSSDRGPDMHRAPDPPFARVRVMEGSQTRRDGAARHIPGQERRGWDEGAGRVRGRLLGPTLSGDRAQLAAQLGAWRSVLRVPRKRAPDHLHHEPD
jgi:hypothetical protein